MKTYAYDYRDERDLSKIIWMLENIVIKKGWDANIGVGPGDYAFGDIRIPAKCVPGFVELLRSLPAAPSLPPMNSTELLLIAHDEWKRREERRHLHPEDHWVSGWLNGVGLPREYLQQQIDRIRKGARKRKESIRSSES